MIDSNGETLPRQRGWRIYTEGDFQIARPELKSSPTVDGRRVLSTSFCEPVYADEGHLHHFHRSASDRDGVFQGYLLVANTYSDTISVINTANNEVERTIDLGLPIGARRRPIGLWRRAELRSPSMPRGITGVALVASTNQMININGQASDHPVAGHDPVAYAPAASVALDTTDNVLLVANDKGIGARQFGNSRLRRHQF